ncbi:MAG: hypothetical protein ACOCXH_02660 [Cyclobacteriaceae bacterium]
MKKFTFIIALILIPMAGKAQKLDETMTWLQNKLDFYSRYVIIDTVGMLTEMSYFIDYHEDNACKARITENARTIGSATYEFHFSELDSNQVEVKQITSVYPYIKIHDDVFLIYLNTKRDNKIIYCSYKGAYTGATFDDQVVIGVKTQDMAERVARGLKHAVKLCSIEDDLFAVP